MANNIDEPIKPVSFAELVASLPPDKTTVELDDDGDILIHPDGLRAYEYWIEADRIDTPAKCVVWILHLSGKTWGNTRVLHEVAKLASKAHGYPLPWGC